MPIEPERFELGLWIRHLVSGADELVAEIRAAGDLI